MILNETNRGIRERGGVNLLTLIKNGYLIDPASARVGNYDVLIEDDRIKAVAENLALKEEGVRIIDASGKYVMPGFIDLHVHLREPGFEYKETIESGSNAAAAGGFTTICPMPNTKPATDCADLVKYVIDKAMKESKVNILPVGAVTLGQDGTTLADIKEMGDAGIIAVSEDGKSVMNTSLYREGMFRAAAEGIPVFAHCEDKDLVRDGVINAGEKAEELNLPGISNAVEDVIAARDILLAKETKAKLHLCHISTKDSIKMLALAKKEGLSVSGEVCPHHFILTDEDILGDDADYKMNPPLRSREDVDAIRQALKDGTIDAIATDHAPHSIEEKAKSFRQAPFGIVGLETAFSLTMTELVDPGIISLERMVELLSVNPAKIIGLERGSLEVGEIADLVIADPNIKYVINKNSFYSKGRNTPFHGKKVAGKILYTLVKGKIVYEDGIAEGKEIE